MIEKIKRNGRMWFDQLIYSLRRANPRLFDNYPQPCAGDNRSYTKFILLSHQRSGSTMVVKTLSRHPQIIAHLEPFLPYRIDFHFDEYTPYESRELLYLRNRYPIEFIEKLIFRGYPHGIQAVGFKMFPETTGMKKFKKVWDWAQKNTGIKIIFLTRKNFLAVYSSLMIAEKTGHFSITKPEDRSKLKIKIDFRKCLAKFEEFKRYDQLILQRFQGHQILQITYEEIVSDFNRSFQKFQNFLETGKHPLECATIRQEVRPLSDIIENYHELQSNFANTEWSYLFQDRIEK